MMKQKYVLTVKSVLFLLREYYTKNLEHCQTKNKPLLCIPSKLKTPVSSNDIKWAVGSV